MGHVFKVIRFVLGLSGEVPHSGWVMLLVAVSGLVSGATTAGMIMLITGALTETEFTPTTVAVAFTLLCIGLPLFRFLSQFALVRLTQRALYRLRLRWSRRILSLPLRQLEELGPPRLLASLTTDLGSIAEALSMLPLLFMHFAIITACLVYLGWLSTSLLLVLLGFLVVGILTYQIPVLRAIVYQRRARKQWDSLLDYIRGVTQGSKELKMHQPRRQALIDDQIEPTAEEFRKNAIMSTTIFAAASSWGQSLFFVAIGLLVFVAPHYMEVTNAVLLGYSITLIHMMTPLETLLNLLPRLTQASVSIRMVEELGITLNEETAEPDADAVPGSEEDWGRLELRGVTHAFRSEVEHEHFLLGPINLEIHPGELLFIVGGNGSGKTTLAKLLLGLYAPEDGTVYLGGEAVTNGNRDHYRQHFSTVFADFFLFNTFLGLDDPHLDSSAQKYLRELQLDHKVKIEGGKLSTTNLSQGQRKRLALLTAYLEDRPIYLFDEWAADQDPFFKDVFYRQLLPELKSRGKTVLVISHDDHYYDAADRIVKLEAGQLLFDQSREQFLLSAASGQTPPGQTKAIEA